jgi:hypothetical protein
MEEGRLPKEVMKWRPPGRRKGALDLRYVLSTQQGRGFRVCTDNGIQLCGLRDKRYSMISLILFIDLAF